MSYDNLSSESNSEFYSAYRDISPNYVQSFKIPNTNLGRIFGMAIEYAEYAENIKLKTDYHSSQQ